MVSAFPGRRERRGYAPLRADERDPRLDRRAQLVVHLDRLEVAHRLEAEQRRVEHAHQPRQGLGAQAADLPLRDGGVARARLRDERRLRGVDLCLAGRKLRRRGRDQEEVALETDAEKVVLDVGVEERQRAGGSLGARGVALASGDLQRVGSER